MTGFWSIHFVTNDLKVYVNSVTVTDSNSDSNSKDLIIKCPKVTCWLILLSVFLEVINNLIFLKRRITPYALRDSVPKILKDLVETDCS